MDLHVSSQWTRLLIALIVAAGALATLGFGRLQSQRRQALNSEADLQACLADLAAMSPGVERSALSPQGEVDPELNRRLRSAADAAGLADQLASIDPLPPRPLRDTEYDEMLVVLHLNAATVKQVVTFLHQLSATDRAMRTKMIEMATPETAGASGPPATQPAPDELWTTDVTLAYLSFAPRHKPQ